MVIAAHERGVRCMETKRVGIAHRMATAISTPQARQAMCAARPIMAGRGRPCPFSTAQPMQPSLRTTPTLDNRSCKPKSRLSCPDDTPDSIGFDYKGVGR